MIRADRRVRWSVLLVLVLVTVGGAAVPPTGGPQGQRNAAPRPPTRPSPSVRPVNASTAPDGFTAWAPRRVSGTAAPAPEGRPASRAVRPDASAVAPIVVTTPRPGEEVTGGGVAVGGSASVPGGRLGLRLRDDSGGVVAQQFTTATAAAPARGRFSARLHYRQPSAPAGWTLQVFVVAADGSVGYLVEVPLRVLPEER